MIILLHGPDNYRSRQRLHFYREGFKKKYDPSGLNVVRLDGEKLLLEDFRTNVGQMGFLSEKRFVSIENVITKNKNKKLQEALTVYLDNEGKDGDNVIIFLEETKVESGKRKSQGLAGPLFQRLQKEKVEEFPLLRGAPLRRWIDSEVARRGGTISSQAVNELAVRAGADLWQINSEIDKLIHYREGREITMEDVAFLVKGKFDENIFHLTDALASRDAKQSFQLLSDQLNSGAHELYILTMLIRQFRILLQVRDIIDEEPNYYTVAARLKLHPFVAQKAIRDAAKFSISELKNIHSQLLDIDVYLKSTQDNPRLLFDLLIARVCQSA